MVAGSSPANPAIHQKVVMIKRVKLFIKKMYIELRYQTWKAKIFTTKNDPRIKKIVNGEIYHSALMNQVLSGLDRLPKHKPQRLDDYVDWFAGTIPHDWENRIEERIRKKEED